MKLGKDLLHLLELLQCTDSQDPTRRWHILLKDYFNIT